MKWFLTFVTVLLISSGFTAKKAHDFYVSITELNVVNDTVQISIRVFTDDLASVLKEENHQAFALSKASDFEKNQHAITRYLEGKFTVGNSVKPSKINWLGHEYEEEVTWIYGEAVLPKQTSILFVKNAIMIEFHEKQQNIIHLKREDGFETELCSQRKNEVRFTL
jgi:hypothetical protein